MRTTTWVRLTVAVATCGRPEALGRCLAALRVQKRCPDEIIVVDQDPSVEAQSVVRRSGIPIVYRQQLRRGLSASRNLALATASGNVLAVTDDDCAPDPDWCGALVEALETDVPPSAVTGPILAPPGDPPAGMHAFSLRTSLESRKFSARTIPWTVGSGANFAAPVALLRQVGGWDERLGAGTPGMAAEDCELLDRLLSSGAAIHYAGGAVVRHDWQTSQRRKATRWSYGFGIGAMCGLRLTDRDPYAFRMFASYVRMHLSELARYVRCWNMGEISERLTALHAILPGCVHGLQISRSRPAALRFPGERCPDPSAER